MNPNSGYEIIWKIMEKKAYKWEVKRALRLVKLKSIATGEEKFHFAFECYFQIYYYHAHNLVFIKFEE